MTTAKSGQDPAIERPLRYDVVALVASAGGIRALARVLSEFDASFPAAILVVLHLDPDHPSHLSGILARHTKLPVEEARDGVRIASGCVYVGPPDHQVDDRHHPVGLG